MTESEDVIPRWKNDLNSKCSDSHIKALAEIIATIGKTDKCEREKVYGILLNREICHFLCEILSSNALKKTPFINKVICFLSESPKFYRDEIFRVLKTYLRLLNALPETRLLYCKFNKYMDDIFKCITVILLRSRQLEATPFHDERFSLIQFVAVATRISNCFHFHYSALFLINVMIEVISPLIVTQEVNTQQHINQYMINIIRNLIIERDKLNDVRYFMVVSKIICNMTAHVKGRTNEDRIIMKIATDKALELIEYILIEVKLPMIFFELFCNFLYQMLRCGSAACKKLLLNLIFKLKGHRLLINMIRDCENEAIVVKCQIILAEIISQLIQFLQNEGDEKIKLRYIEMVLKSRTDNDCFKMLKVIIMYIDLKWQPWTESRHKVASIGSALSYFHDQKLLFDEGVRYCLISAFISSSNQDQSIKKASKVVEKFSESVRLEMDLKFVKWWLIEHPNKKDEREKLLLKFVSRRDSCFGSLNRSDIAIFSDSSKLLVKNFLDKGNDKLLRQNLLKIFTKIQLNAEDLPGLLAYFQRLIAKDTSSETVYIMAALKLNASQFHDRVCKTTTSFIFTLLGKEFKSIDIRAGALDLALALINQLKK